MEPGRLEVESAVSRRFLAPVTSRVADKTTDQILRNHDERIRELVREAQKAGRRWRTWAGAALQPVTETQDISRSSFLYIMNAAGSGILAPDIDLREQIVEIHGVVDAAAAASVTMSLRSRPGGGGGSTAQVGGSATSVGTSVELLSLRGLRAGLVEETDALCVFFEGATAGDRVHTVVVVTEPR